MKETEETKTEVETKTTGDTSQMKLQQGTVSTWLIKGTMPPHSATHVQTNKNDVADQIRVTTVAKTKKPAHPPPKNKDAKQHLTRLQQLGYSNFNDLDIAYW